MAMSVGRVSHHWLENKAGLSRSEVASLLSTLESEGVLEVESGAAPQQAPVRNAGGPLAHLLAFLRRAITLRRKGLFIEVVLAEPVAPRVNVAARAPDMFAGLPPAEQKLIAKKLRELLDRHPAARQVLSHLAVLDRALHRRGGVTVDDLPTELLRQALCQLQALAAKGNEDGLGQLRARLTLALIRREVAPAEPDEPTVDAVLSEIYMTGRLEVDEVGLSAFMEADRVWQSVPAALPKGSDPALAVKRQALVGSS